MAVTLPHNYLPMFESYWLQLDGSNNGEVNAITAASFLKKSQLDDKILHKIWDVSDPVGKGYLDKQGFFVALQLVSVCQCGREPALKNIMPTDPPPKFVGLEHSIWSIESNERTTYNANFERLQPINGQLNGEKVRPFLMSSQLPMEALGKIWNLSDMDRDGNLDADEFAVAMKLISLCKKGEVLPLTLPMSLIPATKATKLGLAPPSGLTAAMTSPRAPSPIVPGKSSSDWVVTADIKTKYDTYFEGIDSDRDGIVNGEQARGIFMASGLPSNILAHVWNLCDIDNTGKLNKEQFALAMYLISEKVKGRREVPGELPPSMIPPSKRKGAVKTPTSSGKVGGVPSDSAPVQSFGSFDSTPSLSSSSILSPSSSAGILQPTISGIKGHTPSTTPLLPQTSSASTLSNIGSSPSILQPVPSATPPLIHGGGVGTAGGSVGVTGGGSLLQPTPMGGAVLQPTGSSSPQLSGTGGFMADFSAIKQLDTISVEIDDIKKEKQQLQQDVLLKQEILVKSKEEVGSLHANLQETNRQREQLEKQKHEVQAQLEEIDNQKSKMEAEIVDIKQKCQAEKEEINRLQTQLKEQESSKSQQQNELQRLQQQLQDMQREEQQLKENIDTSRNELQKMQSDSQTIQQKFGQVQIQLDQYHKDDQQLSSQLGSFSLSSNVHDTISNLPSDLNVPSFGETDALSARATAGSCSPVSSISGFSTASHTEEQNDERDRTDTLTSAAIPDPFSSFSDPFSGSFNSSTNTNGGGQNNSSFDPFSAFKMMSPPTNGNGGGFTSFPPAPSSTKQPTATSSGMTSSGMTSSGMDVFGSFPPTTVTASSTQHSTGTADSNTIDPFSGSDPFGIDPFSSVATPKATTQPTFSGTSLFGSSDPFSSQTTSSSDPFASSDPFSSSGSDLFGGNPFGSSSGFSSDPFASMTDSSKTK